MAKTGITPLAKRPRARRDNSTNQNTLRWHASPLCEMQRAYKGTSEHERSPVLQWKKSATCSRRELFPSPDAMALTLSISSPSRIPRAPPTPRSIPLVHRLQVSLPVLTAATIQ